MTQKYDWDSIRVRLARGETAYKISKSLGGKPARQYIMKYAKKRDWMIGESTIPDSVKNLPLVQVGNRHPRKRTPETVNAILGFIGSGATDEIAAVAAGVSRTTLSTWKKECPEFSELIQIARMNKIVEWISKLDKAKDPKIQHLLLKAAPETSEQFAASKKVEGPTIILNIHRDEVVVEPVVVGRTEVNRSILEVKDEENLSRIDESEPVEESANWQDITIEEKLQSEQQALEQRLIDAKKYNTS